MTLLRMALLLMVVGPLLAWSGGCGVDHSWPFRVVGGNDAGTDLGNDLGGTGGTGVDAGTDIAPEVGPVNCPVTQVGYSTVGTPTMGGGTLTPIVVTTLAQLRAQAAVVGPLVIAIRGTISFNDGMINQVEVTSDKTIQAAAPGAGLVGGGLLIKSQHNVIVRNLTISKPLAPADAVSVQAADHVWIDHCDFSSDTVMPKDTYDGLVDITHGSDYVTISWTRFHDHINNTSLVGHSAMPSIPAEDIGHLTVTYHHNLFLRTLSGSPRARFGHVHVFGNHYISIDNFAIASATSATLLIEGNVFDQVAMPITTHYEDMTPDGTVWDLNNLYNPTSSAQNNMILTPMNNWRPPYPYAGALDSTDSVPAIVETCAGVGKVP